MPAVTPPMFDFIYGVKEAEVCNKALATIGAELIKNTEEDTKQSRLCRVVYADTRDELLRNYPFNFAVRIAMIPNDPNFVPRDEFRYAYKAEEHEDFQGGADTVNVISSVVGLNINEALIGRAMYGVNVRPNTRIIAIDEVAQTITLDRATTGAATNFTVHIPILKIVELAQNNTNIFEPIGAGRNRRILTNVSSGLADDGATELVEMQYIEQLIDPSLFDSLFSHALALRIASKISMDLTKDMRVKQAVDQEFSAIFQAAKVSSSEERQIDSPDTYWSEGRTLPGTRR